MILGLVLTVGNIYNQCVINTRAGKNVCLDENENGIQLEGEVINGDVVQTKLESLFFESSLNQIYYTSSMLSDTAILDSNIEWHPERTKIQSYISSGKLTL